ncbi:MAG TPA: hypothetical protein VGJ94_00050 [Syntrophorhabdaceae bacterium]
MPVRAYRMQMPASVDLSRHEGKTITVHGFLAPGDRFTPKGGNAPVIKKETCSHEYRKVISREIMMEYAVGALRAADKKDFKEAERLIAKAVDMDKNDCQTYIDRAYIHYAKGDIDAGRTDIKRVLDRQCPDRSRLNFLILGDVAKQLCGAGKKHEAEEVYRLALETCQSDICRDSVGTELKRLEASERK